MQTSQQTTGQIGEDLAAQLLTAMGYRITARNQRQGRAEIDIIAEHGPFLVFVEVKTRTSSTFQQPEEAVGEHKRNKLQQAMNEYLVLNPWVGPVRYDIVSMVLLADGYKARIFKDAIS